MEMLRLPLIGDYVYASRIVREQALGSKMEEPEVERRYIVTDLSDDGYYINPEDEPSKEPSQIKYLFASQRWVVVGGEDAFNIRIEMNPALRDIPDLYEHPRRITEAISHDRLEEADDLINEYQRFIIPRMLTMTADPDNDDIYEMIFTEEEESDTDVIPILEWLKRNHIIDYHLLLSKAIRQYDHDLIAWILDQNVDLLEGFGKERVGRIRDAITNEVIPQDDVNLFQMTSRFTGLFDAFDEFLLENKRRPTDPSNMLEFVEKEYPESTNILEFLRSVPPKPVQSKHLR